MLASWASMTGAVSIAALPLRVDNPKPDGSGVVFIQLQADPSDPNISQLDHFNITGITFSISGQSLRLWDSTNNNCNGTELAVNSVGTRTTTWW